MNAPAQNGHLLEEAFNANHFIIIIIIMSLFHEDTQLVQNHSSKRSSRYKVQKYHTI
jgi:hypothetical protein